MHVDLFTLFPAMCEPYLSNSILGRAQESGILSISLHNIRDYATGRHRVTDDAPYGGGGGMVMKPEPVFAAVETVLGKERSSCPIILLTPQGRTFTQKIARELAQNERVALIAGRYEGVDERIRQHLASDEISMGDFVLTGGELPALAVIDATTRMLPGSLGNPKATANDSHGDTGLLQSPHYTRPSECRGWHVPAVLLSGDHARVELWRREQSLRRTWERRPELLLDADVSETEKEFLATLADEGTNTRLEYGL